VIAGKLSKAAKEILGLLELSGISEQGADLWCAHSLYTNTKINSGLAFVVFNQSLGRLVKLGLVAEDSEANDFWITDAGRAALAEASR
jgi:hypothetical protein